MLFLPVYVHFAGATEAVPVFTIAGLLGNLTRAVMGFHTIAWRKVVFFCFGALPGAILGAEIFVELPPAMLRKALSVFLILLIVGRNVMLKKPWPDWALVPGGFGSALLSGVFGFAGPFSAAIFFSLGLSPLSYIASEATTAVFTHVTKTIAYSSLSVLSNETIVRGVYFGLVMAAGAWGAKRWLLKIPAEKYSRAIEAVFVIVAVSLLL